MKEIPFSPQMMERLGGIADITGSPPEDSDNSEQIERMKSALTKALTELTDKQLEVVQMYFWDDMTQQEIAKELGTSQQMVAKHLKYALKKLRNSRYFTDCFG